MSKTIKVKDEVYVQMELEREKRETFSECIARLIRVARTLRSLDIGRKEE